MPQAPATTSNPSLLRKARVLIVDDLPDTRDRVCLALEPLVGKAQSCSPDEARRIVRFGHTPVDLVLTDLRFPPEKEDGRRHFASSVPAHGLALLQGFGSECPPCMIFTGSVSSIDFARMQSKAVAPDGTPAARFVLKSAGIKALTEQMEGALQDGLKLKPSERAKILGELPEPSFNINERFDRENAVALATEKLSNFMAAFVRCIEILKSDCDLEKWPSWTRNGPLLVQESEALKQYDSKRFLGKKPLDTLDALHQVSGRFLLLDPEMISAPPDLPTEKAALAGRLLSDLAREYKHTHESIADSFAGFREHAKGLFSLDEDLHKLFDRKLIERDKPIYYYRRELEGSVKIPDPDGVIRTFLKSVNAALEGRIASVEIRYCDREYGMQDYEERRATMNWGDGYRFSIRVLDGDKPAWTYMEGLRYSIKELVDAKILYCDKYQFSSKAEQYDCFEFFIKANEIDREAEAKESRRLEGIKITELAPLSKGRGEMTVKRSDVASGSFTAIDFDPQLLCKHAGNLCAVEYNGAIIVAHARAHFEADRAIYFYLKREFGANNREALQVARESLRMRHEYEKCLVVENDFPWMPKLDAALKDIGMKVSTAGEYDLTPRVELSRMYLHDDDED